MAASHTEVPSATGGRTPTAKDLADLLPQWTRSYVHGGESTRSYVHGGEPLGPAEYTKLKAAALVLARAPEQERRNVIAAYSWAYCEMTKPDAGRASGIFLLLRVLFVVPGWPLHAEGDRVLRVDPCCGTLRFDQMWSQLAQYDSLAKRFPRRSPAEIEALEIR